MKNGKYHPRATGAKVLLFHACHNISKADFESGKSSMDLMTGNVEALKEALQYMALITVSTLPSPTRETPPSATEFEVRGGDYLALSERTAPAKARSSRACCG
jgi:hypothetical protein